MHPPLFVLISSLHLARIVLGAVDFKNLEFNFDVWSKQEHFLPLSISISLFLFAHGIASDTFPLFVKLILSLTIPIGGILPSILIQIDDNQAQFLLKNQVMKYWKNYTII